MTNQSCGRAQTASLSTTNADQVTFTRRGKYLCVTNHSATENLHFRCDRTTAVRDADDNYVILPGDSKTLGPSLFGGDRFQLSLVGSANKYTAEVF